MLRKPGLYCLCAAAVLLWGCDLFSTREFRSKPAHIRSLAGLAAKGDSISFRISESVWKKGGRSPEALLSRRRLVFTYLEDSLSGTDTLKVLSLNIEDDSTGSRIESGVRLVRFAGDGVVLEGAAADGGARFFPLKVSSAAGPSRNAGASLAAQDPDEGGAPFTVLPALLVEGWSENQSMGVLEVKRLQTSVDTLAYQGRSEEAWGVAETVMDGGRILAEGMFWYGASGLLRAEQTWPDFGWRDANGAVPAAADAAAGLELRRTLERL